MKLPNANNLIVEREKIAGYLLNTSHRQGAPKARFFQEFGFHADRWEELADALRLHGVENEVVSVIETGYGPRYNVHGPLQAPNSRRPQVLSVWQMDHGAVAPRLITAYPD